MNKIHLRINCMDLPASSIRFAMYLRSHIYIQCCCYNYCYSNYLLRCGVLIAREATELGCKKAATYRLELLFSPKKKLFTASASWNTKPRCTWCKTFQKPVFFSFAHLSFLFQKRVSIYFAPYWCLNRDIWFTVLIFLIEALLRSALSLCVLVEPLVCLLSILFLYFICACLFGATLTTNTRSYLAKSLRPLCGCWLLLSRFVDCRDFLFRSWSVLYVCSFCGSHITSAQVSV